MHAFNPIRSAKNIARRTLARVLRDIMEHGRAEHESYRVTHRLCIRPRCPVTLDNRKGGMQHTLSRYYSRQENQLSRVPSHLPSRLLFPLILCFFSPSSSRLPPLVSRICVSTNSYSLSISISFFLRNPSSSSRNVFTLACFTTGVPISFIINAFRSPLT